MGDKKGIFFVLIGAGSFGFTPVFAKLGFTIHSGKLILFKCLYPLFYCGASS